MVRKEGISIDCHFVTTSDGYILRLYHLIRPSNDSTDESSPNLRPVLMMHGMLGSSQDFVLYPNISAGKLQCVRAIIRIRSFKFSKIFIAQAIISMRMALMFGSETHEEIPFRGIIRNLIQTKRIFGSSAGMKLEHWTFQRSLIIFSLKPNKISWFIWAIRKVQQLFLLCYVKFLNIITKYHRCTWHQYQSF